MAKKFIDGGGQMSEMAWLKNFKISLTWNLKKKKKKKNHVTTGSPGTRRTFSLFFFSSLCSLSEVIGPTEVLLALEPVTENF